MDSQRHGISRTLRSPHVWITGSILGVILLAAAASSSNLSLHGHQNHNFDRKSVVNLEFLKMKNDFDLVIGYRYCNCYFYWYCNCHDGNVVSDRVLPEGLFAIAKQLEETMSSESSPSEYDKDRNTRMIPVFDEQKETDYDLNKAGCISTSQRPKLLAKDQNEKIADLQRRLDMKENEAWKLRHELIRKEQEEKLEELRAEVALLKGKMEKIEADLEKQTIEHLSAGEQLMALAGKVNLTEKNVAELHEQNLQAMLCTNNVKEESQVSDVRELIIQLREEVHRKSCKWEARDLLKAWLVSVKNDKNSTVRMEIELEPMKEESFNCEKKSIS